MNINTKVALRVLYTVNTSPQYILAKAPEKIPLVLSDTFFISKIPPNHGRASLKTCASAILRSSPELTPDGVKDFSVYVLDPLEDFHSKSMQSNGETAGIAVGLGLLSAVLSPRTPESTMVTGTFVDYPKGEGSLEVVLSLRQVTPNVALMQISQKSSSKFDTSNTDTEGIPGHQDAKTGELLCKATGVKSSNQQNNITSSVGYCERKPDPAHFTRAHLLPTPYIGPPKRQYNSSGKTQSKRYAEPVEPQRTVIDVDAIPSPSRFSRAAAPAPPPNPVHELSQNAVMLAALSSLSSGDENEGSSNDECDKPAPNPQLVAFLRAYLSALETQNCANTSSPPSTPDPLPLTSDSYERATERATDVKLDNARDTANKENVQPARAKQFPKEKVSTISVNTSLLGSNRYNAQTSIDGSNRRSSTVISEALTPVVDPSKKRKLDDGTTSDKKTPLSGQSNTFSSVEHEDLTGTRVNRGWGGLRLRADGSFSGGHPPRPNVATDCAATTCSVSVQQRYFFRSSSTTALEQDTRKGPYVVPDWARGVPPPAPPQKDVAQDENDEECLGRKKRKSKGLERLGGENILKRRGSAIEGSVHSIPLSQSDPVVRTEQEPQDECTRTPRTSPKRSSPVRLPLIAQSSPLAKTAYASFFQAFQTSPCRPSNSVKNTLMTPKKLTSSATAPDSVKYSSLFTPSPISALRGAKTAEPFDIASEPPSPTPIKKRARPSRELSLPLDSKLQIREQDLTTPGSDVMQSTRISTADNDKRQRTLRTSMDPSSLNFDKVHDWSSLNLPPSSPPPPSSPSMMPSYDSDLPCSDIPSSDMSGGETPQDTTEQSCNDDSQEQHISYQAKSIDTLLQDHVSPALNFSDIPHFMAVPAIPDFSLNTFVEEGSAAESALNALKNGLGELDFTEAWGLLDDILQPKTSDADTFFKPQEQDWLSMVGSSSRMLGGQEEPQANSIDFNIGDADYASFVASNFEELLKDCIV